VGEEGRSRGNWHGGGKGVVAAVGHRTSQKTTRREGGRKRILRGTSKKNENKKPFLLLPKVTLRRTQKKIVPTILGPFEEQVQGKPTEPR